MSSTQLFLTHAVCYWGAVAWYMVKDYNTMLMGKWHLKNNPTIKTPSNLLRAYYRGIKLSLVNMVISAMILFLILRPPQGNVDIKKICMGWVASEIWAWCSHKAMHTKWLYKYHKQHHLNLDTIATSLDGHPIEHVIFNIGVVAVFVIVAGNPLPLVVMAFATLSSVTSHSGYSWSLAHGIHHKIHNVNYGFGFYIMDRLTGTWQNSL